MGAENIALGTCEILLDGTDLGLTIGGVEVDVETSTHPTNVDQFGGTVVAEHITGRNVTVKVPMAETTLENLAKIMPGAELVTDASDSTMKKVVVKTGIGINLRDLSLKLVLHPIDKPAGDKSEDFIVPLASTPGGISFAYKIDQERVYMADFKGYPDPDGVLFLYGDEAASE